MTFLFWFCLFLIVYTYVLYPVSLLAVRLLSRRRSQLFQTHRFPHVTIVVSVFNEERSLEEKLVNLGSIEYPPDRISFLIGSDGSTDRTMDILRASKVRNLEVRDFSTRRGKAQVLNDLIPNAKGEIVILSDANTYFDSDAVSKLVRHFADAEVGAVCGALILRSDGGSTGGYGESMYWRYENMLKQLESDIRTTVGATGGIYSIRKSLFKPLPTTKAVPDDLLLPMNVLRRGTRIIYEPEAVAYEDLSNSVTSEFQRKVRIGTSDFHSVTELGSLLHPRSGFVAYALWSRKIIRWCVPLLLILLLASSAFMALESGFFQIILLGQGAFYLTAVMGCMLDRAGVRLAFVGLPCYFVVMNLALLVGFVRFVIGKQPFTWEVVR